MPENDLSRDWLIVASCPGGIARQYRVQVTSSETPSHWKLAGSFRDARAARACATRLQTAGQQTRIIDCRALPTAA
jgi:hypothetical protein